MRIVETQQLTNFRVGKNNNYVRLADIDKIIDMNKYTKSKAKLPYSGPYTRLVIGKSPRITQTIGEVAFLSRESLL